MKKQEITSLKDFQKAITNHTKKESELENWFHGLANCLMSHLVLEVGESKYRIVECEIY